LEDGNTMKRKMKLLTLILVEVEYRLLLRASMSARSALVFTTVVMNLPI
jgi:hypothetical protein